jgi:aryl-alcohol dehydrogenase-like predicted oxidoreductase
VVHAALDCGITFIDTANVYGSGASEEFVGAAVNGRRDRVIIATKFGFSMGEGVLDRGGSRVHVRRAVEASLRRLETDYIDLYQFHRPDPDTPIEETLSTLDDLVREGKVRYIGSSQSAGWQIANADWTARVHGWERFVSAQNRYNLLDRAVEREVIPACAHYGIGLIPFTPLANGLLTGKYRRGEPPAPGTKLAGSPNVDQLMSDANFDVIERLEAFARERDLSLLQVAIGGLAAQPQVATVIAGAMSPEQVAANAQAGLWEPAIEELAELNAIAPMS